MVGRLSGDHGAVLIGAITVLGGIAIVPATIQQTYYLGPTYGLPFPDVVYANPAGFVLLPAVALLGWVLVGSLLLFGRRRMAPIAAVVFGIAAVINVVALLLHLGATLPLILFVDPITPIVSVFVVTLSLSLGLGPSLGPLTVLFGLTVGGTFVTFLAMLYFGVQSVRRYLL